MVFFIGTILRYILGTIGIHGTYVVIATIAISCLIGQYLRSNNLLGQSERKEGRRRRRQR